MQPVNATDEQVLSHHLHDDIDGMEFRGAPVRAVMRRGRAIRLRRRLAVATGAAALAAAGVIVATQVGAAPARQAPAGPLAPAVTMTSPDPRAPGGVFASGMAAGAPWQLAVANVAGQGRCLAAVMLNGRRGDLLQPPAQVASAIGNAAVLAGYTSYAFVQLQPRVTSLIAHTQNGRQFAVQPVNVPVCGRTFRLAGFAFGAAAVTRIAPAYAGAPGPAAASYRLGPAPSPGTSERTWHNSLMQAASRSGIIGSGSAAGRRWRVTLTLSAAGECYSSSALRADSATRSTVCGPIELPPSGARLHQVLLARGTLTGYAGLVSGRTAVVIARRSGGVTTRVVPEVVAGRKYVAFAAGPGGTLSHVTLRGASGRILASLALGPARR
jgi:hypothetical protein